MIPFAKVDGQVLARLDAVGTDHYDLSLDRIPAVNGAQYLLQSTLSSLIEGKKFSGEALRDLNSTAVFQTSVYGQIDLDALIGATTSPVPPHKLWTVIGVYPEFISAPPAVIVPDPVDERSRILNTRFIRPLKGAKRYTQEQQAQVNTDIFAPGSPKNINPAMQEYGYLFGTKPVTSGSMPPETVMTVVGGPAGRKAVAVSYLRVPKTIPPMADEQDPLYAGWQIEWPPSMEELIVSAALRIISIKAGDGTTVNTLSAQELNMLLQVTA